MFHDFDLVSRSQLCQEHKLHIHFYLDSCLLWFKRCLVATYIEKITHNMICGTDVCSREIMNMFLVGQVFGLIGNINIAIFSGTINVINAKLHDGTNR